MNCFRIDVPVASEGFVANTPGADRTGWESTDVPAEGILWMLRQPATYTGWRESMYHLREREGIMKSAVSESREGATVPGTELYNGLWAEQMSTIFAEPT